MRAQVSMQGMSQSARGFAVVRVIGGLLIVDRDERKLARCP
jgi:hypothetical protein